MNVADGKRAPTLSFVHGQSTDLSVQRGVIASRFLIHQGGGRVDRGDYVDYFRFNNLPPLSVGDEYVLFVYTASNGEHTIVGAEEGAFRIRNGRVNPLGKGGASVAWQKRPSTEFFDALRALR